MRLLLDTHVFLWWRMDAPSLPQTMRAAIGDRANEVLVSAAACWEIVIKRQLGKLEFGGAVAAALAEEGFTCLSIAADHVDEVAALPDHHRDPFDRLMVAQARRERLTLLTVDPLVLQYGGFDRVS